MFVNFRIFFIFVNMKYTTTHIIYFSPTHTSQMIARAIAEGIGMKRRIETDLTLDKSMHEIVVKDAITIVAVPVYAGRVAPIALQRIQRFKGDNTPVILTTVYGNRDYEDALVELRDTVILQGFIPLSAGAFIGEHSYSRKGMPIAEGRPDGADIIVAQQFGIHSLNKLERVSSLSEIYPFYIKGNIPYRSVNASTPIAPVVNEELCCICGECINLCPTEAIFINAEKKIKTDKMKCIKCCACVKECPTGARVFDTPYTAMLHAKCSVRREAELFI